jgi:hypothetical protein
MYSGKSVSEQRAKQTKLVSNQGAGWIRPHGSKLSQLNRLLIDESAAFPVLSDGNSLVDWDSVRGIDVLVEAPPTCAICLELVSVPEMLQCGHAFCLPCILLHFTTASSCCVCSEYARPSDLRSMRIQFTTPAQSGRMRTFQLTHTEAGVTLPVSGVAPTIPNQRSPGWWFSRVVSVSDEEILRLHLSEKARILEQEPFTETLEGIHSFGTIRAIEFLDQRIASLGFISSPNMVSDPDNIGIASIDIDQLSFLTRVNYSPSAVYTYQLVDGQHVYLESLWTRILLAHFGGKDEWDLVDSLPTNIALPIVHTTSFTVDLDTQKRYRHLSHLPIGTSITFCDVDLRGIVTTDVLESMSGPIARRLDQIRQVKNQRKSDKRDVRKANAVPLSREWGVGVSIGMPAIPSQEEFVPLVAVESRDDSADIAGPSFASLAADLSSANSFEPIPYTAADRHYKASEASSATEEEMLLQQYSRRASSQPVAEIESLLHQAELNLQTSTPPELTQKRKNNKVKLRIAG